MKTTPRIISTGLLMIGLIAFNNNAVGQITSICTINSSCGYTVEVSITPTTIVPNSLTCLFGYSYNVTFNYSITVSGSNTCWNGNIGIQPSIFCNTGQNNGYFTVNVPAPIRGTSTIRTYAGTLTTTTSQYRALSDCATATPTSLGCNSLDISIFGPGIPFITISCIPNTPLPIELLFFNAKCNNKNVTINWATATETNNSYFTIERSKDAINWKIIGTVDGAENSNQTINYSFIDTERLTATSYYRLKQTDFDGNFRYNNIIALTCKNKNFSIINIYPNPNNGKVIIDGVKQNAALIIFNSIGAKIIEQNISSEKTEIYLKNLPSGIYFVQISLEKEIITRKLSINQ
jgi:hypothetical protein